MPGSPRSRSWEQRQQLARPGDGQRPGGAQQRRLIGQPPAFRTASPSHGLDVPGTSLVEQRDELRFVAPAVAPQGHGGGEGKCQRSGAGGRSVSKDMSIYDLRLVDCVIGWIVGFA
ncbi:MAG: hypothetical protein OHK0022_13480 [Roseiflexaceae bacterium]